MLLILIPSSVPSIGENTQMTLIALLGALQDEYAACPSNPVTALIAALTPIVDGYYGHPNL
jgi:hypothetical protein